MKRLLMLAASVIAALGLTSCEPEMSKAIVGTWEATTMEATIEGINLSFDLKEMGVNLTFVFKDDGTGSIIEKEDGETVAIDFDYSVEEGYLTLDDKEDVESVPLSIDGKKMILTLDGEMFDEPGIKVKVHFVKK